MIPEILLSNVSVERGRYRVVHDVALGIERGKWFGLIGANGSGKTSLLRALAGRLPIAAGSCEITNVDVTNNRASRAKVIGFAPPAETLPDKLRVRDVLALIGGSLDQAVGNIGELRLALGLDVLIDKWIGDCSAGMRQRLAIAIAFAAGQKIVVLDEPFNWLDPVAAYDVKQVLRKVTAAGLTLITALHDLSTLTQTCDAAAVMADGRIVFELDAAELLTSSENLPEFERRMIDALRTHQHQ